MVPPSPPPTPEQLREAIRDLTGILRALYLADPEPFRRAPVVTAGRRLAELEVLLDQPESEAYQRAMRAADDAMNEVFRALHFNASLAPVLGHAAGRVLASRRR